MSHFKAIFLVKSPLQLLNAVEARHGFDFTDSDSLLLLMANRKSLGQLLNLIRNDNSWSNVISLDDLSINPVPKVVSGKVSFNVGARLFSNDLFGIIKLKKLARQYPFLEKVFIGDLGNPLMTHFANCLPKAKVVALDDGNATYKYAQIRNGDLSYSRKQSTNKKIKLFFKKTLLGLKDAPLKSIIFFTTYDIQVGNSDQLIKHNFNLLRAGLLEINSTEEIFFLGSPLVEAEILAEDEFFQQLFLVSDLFKGEKVKYIAHRRESPARLKLIKQKLGWDTALFDYPIEFQLAKIGPRPKILASFFSSAIENCLTLYGDMLPIMSFRLASEFFIHKDSPRGQGILALYDHYESLQNGYFEVVQLEADRI